MRARTSIGAVGLALLALCTPRRAEPADDKSPFRVAFVGPLSGPLATAGAESLEGLRHAAAWRTKSEGGIGKRPLEIVPFDDKDDPGEAEKLVGAAIGPRFAAIVHAATGRTIEASAARARKGKTPILYVGSAGAAPRVGWNDPVVSWTGWPVDQALAAANYLLAPARSRFPAIVAEDTPRGRELEAALVRNIGFQRKVVGVVRVAPHAGPTVEDLARLREAKADRLVLIGEPDLVDTTVAALGAASWDVPLFGMDGTVSGASSALRDGKVPAGSLFLVGSPELTVAGPPTPLYRLVDDTSKGASTTIWPRTIAGYAVGTTLFDGAASTGAKPAKELDLVAGIRDRRYGEGESRTPLVDVTGRAALWRATLWKPSPTGPVPLERSYLPDDQFGALLSLRRKESFVAEPGTKVVWVTFGDEKSRPPRTIEKDLALLHLGTRGYEGNLDEVIREELMARTLGKLSRLFLRNEDGTSIPGVSFHISFTATKPEGFKTPAMWEAVIAGDDAEAGGRAWPGDGHCEIYATFLRRTIFQAGALEPALSYEDKPYLDDTIPWKGERLEHLRADRIRALVDGYAGGFALTGAHEVGHLAGLGHDATDPRSIMNVTEGAGLRETQAWFIPPHQVLLERTLGRAPLPKPEKGK